MTGEKVEVKEGEAAANPSFLDEVKKERELLQSVREENKKILEEMKNLRAEDILSGKAPVQKETVKEESPLEYLNKVTGGKYKRQTYG